MKCELYKLLDNKLYMRNYEGIYLKCLGRNEAKEVFENFHDKNGIGHGSTKEMTHMILRSSYFWPSIFKDTFEHVHSCHVCQTSVNRERHPKIPLQPVYEVCPFTKWGLDFIGPINPSSSIGHTFILIARNYFT